jgi:hypothetical protein
VNAQSQIVRAPVRWQTADDKQRAYQRERARLVQCFMPLAWEDVEKQQARGDYLAVPHQSARIGAGFYATTAMLKPEKAAAMAVGYFARRLNALSDAWQGVKL